MEYSKSELRKFHNYELPEEKLELFEQQIKNEEMNESFENFKLSEQVSAELFTPGYIDLVNQKKGEISKGLPHISEKTKVFTLGKIIGIAASICLVVAAIFVFPTIDMNVSVSDNSSKIIDDLVGQSAMASLNLDHISTIERGDNEKSNRLISLYQSEKYALLIKEFNQDETNQMLQLLQARSFMHLKEFDEASRLLNDLHVEAFPQKDALLWSLVETSIGLDDVMNTKNYLNEIISNKYPNYKHAQTILSKLN